MATQSERSSSHLQNISLIGARGAGKSKISRKFARLTGRVCLSTDTLISYEAGGVPISEIVAAEGWVGFRNREYEVLRKVTSMENVIIDCGGGILMEPPPPEDPAGTERPSERKIELLKQHSTVVYLRRNMEWLLGKDYSSDPSRPDLGGEYEALLKRRLPLLEEVADLTLDLSSISLDEAIRRLVERFPGTK